MSCSFVEVSTSSLLHNYSNTLLCGNATRIVVKCATWVLGWLAALPSSCESIHNGASASLVSERPIEYLGLGFRVGYLVLGVGILHL